MQPSFLAGDEMTSPDINVLKFSQRPYVVHDDNDTFSQTVGIDLSAKALVGVF